MTYLKLARRLAVFLLFISATLLLQQEAFALPKHVYSKQNARVRAQPNSKAELLIKLNKNKKLQVLGKRARWYKVRVYIDKDFYFDGWVYDTKLNVPRVKKTAKKQSKKKVRRSTSAKKPKKTRKRTTKKTRAKPPPPPADDDLFGESGDIFEEIADSPGSGAPDDLFRELEKDRPKKKKRKPRQALSRRTKPNNPIIDRLELGAGLGYSIDQFSLTDANSSFGYDIPAFVIDIHGEYWYLDIEPITSRLGIQFSYAFGIRSYDVELRDNNNTSLLSETKSGSSQQFDIGATYRYLFSEIDDRPIHVDVMLGWNYYKIDLSDVQLDGEFINLFTGSTFSGVYTGFRFGVPFRVSHFSLGLRAKVKILLLNTYSESADSGQANLSGTSPSANTGFILGGGFFWQMTKNYLFEFAYERRLTSADFTGNGERLSNTSQTDFFSNAKATNNYNLIVLSATYQF